MSTRRAKYGYCIRKRVQYEYNGRVCCDCGGTASISFAKGTEEISEPAVGTGCVPASLPVFI